MLRSGGRRRPDVLAAMGCATRLRAGRADGAGAGPAHREGHRRV